jgi:hypothetical protein
MRMLRGDPGEREGYAEQFATAFALLARLRGFATRIVVGYLLPEQSADGTYRVTEAQAHAWPEVDLEGRGWVVVEPTDVARIGALHDPTDDASDVPPEAPGDEGEPLEAQEPRVIVDDAAAGRGGGTGVRAAAARGGMALLMLLAAVPLVSAGVKLGRRYRRRLAGEPSARVVGAWRETVDRLTEHGLAVGESQTTVEVARQATARFKGAALSVAPLATMVAVAVFAPAPPTDDTARRAWDLERSARRELGSAGGLVGRPWSLFDPRPLVRRRRRRRPRAPSASDRVADGNPADGTYSAVP